MGVNESFDKLVKQKQEKCEHFHQDRITTDHGTFCGKCGVEIKE